ncbi:hypothetical protein HaLaN_00107 [Haematococcus lacustris]|uniref:Uncharacterized protein n=1 Tax=Haematococcus lacustris TaxID=44745 RepID=A0A699YF63_HAELA|nr:hypothetical protein HaLaN_00107 [Haematococcus lacustris]
MFDEMRDTLLAFEATINYNAPAQERAFYNALRTLLSDLLPAAAGPGSERKFGAQHEFFNAFTHEPSPTRPSPAAATSKAAGGTQGSQAPGPPASTAAKASKGNLAGGRAARPPLGLAVVHQPALGSSTSRGLSGKATERLVVKEGEAAGGAGEEEGPGPLMALGSVLAPRATARVGFDPDKVDDTAGAKPTTQSEAAEVEALRQKWSGIERVAASCSAQVHSQALAAGFHSLEHAGAALRTVPGLAPGPTLTSTAREVRCDSVIEYDQHCQRLASRMQQLGLASTMSPEALQAALAPVPDKSYLDIEKSPSTASWA